MAKKIIKPLIALAGALFLSAATIAPAAMASENPFLINNLTTGFNSSVDGEEGKCGDGKCGDSKGEESKCGDSKGETGKCGDAKCGDSKGEEGKCGEAKCGTSK